MATKKPQIEKSVLKKPDGRKNNGGAREGAGRMAFVPTDAERKQVEAMSGYGVPIEQIAILVRGGIDADTLRKHFEAELLAGKAKANSQIAKTLFQKATSGDTTAAIWWTKTQMRWAETQRHQISGDADNPVRVKAQVEAEELLGALLKNVELRSQAAANE